MYDLKPCPKCFAYYNGHLQWPGCPIKVSLEQQSEHYIWHCSDLFVGFKDGVGAVVAVIVVPNINSIHLKRRKWGKTFNIKKN